MSMTIVLNEAVIKRLLNDGGMSAKVFDRMCAHVFANEHIVPTGKNEMGLSTEDLMKGYLEWCRSKGLPELMTTVGFGRVLSQYYDKSAKIRTWDKAYCLEYKIERGAPILPLKLRAK